MADADQPFTLSVYTEDDIGNKSATIDLTVSVDAIQAPSSLSLSLPSSFLINDAEQCDITVGDDGADPNLTYSWERNFNSGGWSTDGFSNATIKNPTLTLTATATCTVQVRCTVTNSGGSTTETSGTVDVVDMAPDVDSSYSDTSSHVLSNTSYTASVVDGSTISVPGTPFAQGDLIQMPNGKIDVVASVSGAGPQDVGLTAETSEAGTVYNLSPTYTVPQIAQQGGQDPFAEMSMEVQWTRNKTSVTESAGDVVINHGTTETYPFRNGDAVVVSGDTDVVTTINAVPTRGTVAGTGNLLVGTPDVFHNTSSEYSDIVHIGNDVVVTVYNDAGNSNYGTACVGTISGTSISWGTPVVFASESTAYDRVAYVDTDKVVVAYYSHGRAKAVVGTVSGSSISFGSIVTVASDANGANIDMTGVGTNTVVVSYKIYSGVVGGGSPGGYTKVGTVSGTSISFGSADQFYNSGTFYFTSLSFNGVDKVVVCYCDVGNSYYGTSRVGTLSGTSISWGTSQVFASVVARDISSVCLDSSTVLVAYRNDGTADSTSCVGTLSGTSISWGTPDAITDTGDYHTVTAIGTDKAVMLYRNGSGRPTASVGTISGTSTSWATPVQIEDVESYSSSIISVDSSKSVVSYVDLTNNEVSSSVLTYDGTNYNTTISVTDALPTNVATIEPLPMVLKGDLNAGTPTYADVTETFAVVNTTTAKATATLSGDSGAYADIRLQSDNVDFNDLTVTRIEATFQA